MAASTSVAARPGPGKAAAARALILSFLTVAPPSAPLSSEAIIQRLNASRLSSPRDPSRPYLLLVSPSGTRTRISELETLGLVEVADSDGRTTAGNACRRYRVTDAGRALVRRHLPPGDALDYDALAETLADVWTAYRARVERPEPAKLLAEVVPAAIGHRSEVRLVTGTDSRVLGWLSHGDTADLLLARDLINEDG